MLWISGGIFLFILLFLTVNYGFLIPPRKGLPILLYHDFDKSHINSLTLLANTFERHLQYLKEKGYSPVTCRDILAFKANRFRLPSRPVAIAIDDAFESAVTIAYPLLKKYGFKATIFIPTAYVGKTNDWDHGNKKILAWQQLNALDSLVFELALHGHRHINFKHAFSDEIENDLTECLKALTDHGVNYTPAIAYPYGGRPKDAEIYKRMITALVSKGILMGLRIGNKINKPPFNNIYELKRITIGGNDSFREFKTKLSKGRVKLF